MRIAAKFFVAVCCVALGGDVAAAAVIYSNIGIGFPADSKQSFQASVFFFATSFTATASGNLASLETDLYGTNSPIIVSLYTNSAGQPGTLLESWAAAVPYGTNFPPPAPITLTSVVNPPLFTGSVYWVVLQATPYTVSWTGNDEGITGGIWQGSSLTTLSQVFTGSVTPGIQVNSVDVPATPVYISDSQNNRVRMVSINGIITTVAGNGIGGYSGDGGLATGAQLHNPYGVALDTSGNLYIADTLNNRIRMVNTSGIISTIAGNGAPSWSGDNGPAINAGLNNPTGVAVDGAGNVYIADQRNNRIRKVTSGTITTVAGTGNVGNGGDGGPALNAQLYYPTGIAVDSSGDFYIADSDNQRVRMVSAAGVINTVAGSGNVGYNCGSAFATNAGLHNPTGVALTPYVIYIADSGNQCIREVITPGIYPFAGDGLASYGGDNGQAGNAALNYPTGVAVDRFGNVYIADYVNNRVREVDTVGIITTIAGTGAAGYTGDGAAAINAGLYNPTGVAVAPAPAP